MTWLLELLFDSLRTMLAQFVVDLMDTVTGVFTDLMCCDLSLFEELFSVASQLYENALMPFSIALLAMICVWQLFKTMFGRVGTGAEEPVELIGRSALCLFCIVYSKRIVDYLLLLAGTPYQWIVGNHVEIGSFSGFVSAAEQAAAPLGLDRLSLQLLLLVMQLVVAWNYFKLLYVVAERYVLLGIFSYTAPLAFATDRLSLQLLLLVMQLVVAWNYFKLLYVVAERYVLLGIFSYTAPLAFATGGAKATNQILANWSKAFGGQIVLSLLDGWGLKMFLAAYGNLLASRHGFTRFFVGCMCLVGFSKIMQKLDSYLASLGANLGRTNTGMSGVAAAVMAGRLAGQTGKAVFGQAVAVGSGSPNGGREGFAGPQSESSGVVEGQPIPMQSEQDRTGGSQEAFQVNPGAQGMSGTFSGTGVKHESGEAETEVGRRNHTGKEMGEGRKAEREAQGEAGHYTASGGIAQEGSGVYDTGMASCEEETASMEEEREALEAAAMAWEQEMPEDAAAYDTGMMSIQEEADIPDAEEGASMEEEREALEAAAMAWEQEMPEDAAAYDTGMMSIQEEADIPDAEEGALSQNPDMGTIQQEGTGFDRQEGYMPEESREQGTEAEQAESLENRGNGSVEAGAVSYGKSRNRENITLSAGENQGTGTEAVNPGAAAAVGFVDAETAGTGSIQHKLRSGIGESPERISGKPHGRRQGGTQERGSMVESPEGVSGESIRMDIGKSGQSAERFVQNGKLYLDAERYEAPEIPYRMESRYGGTYYTVPQSAAEAGQSAERFVQNGKLYLDAERYEAPEIPYRMESRYGGTYYTVPQSAAEGRIEASLREDGSVRYQKNSGYEAPEIPYRMESRYGGTYYTVPQSAAEGRIEASLREDGSVRYQKNSGSGWEPKRKEEHPEQQGQEDGHGR